MAWWSYLGASGYMNNLRTLSGLEASSVLDTPRWPVSPPFWHPHIYNPPPKQTITPHFISDILGLSKEGGKQSEGVLEATRGEEGKKGQKEQLDGYQEIVVDELEDSDGKRKHFIVSTGGLVRKVRRDTETDIPGF